MAGCVNWQALILLRPQAATWLAGVILASFQAISQVYFIRRITARLKDDFPDQFRSRQRDTRYEPLGHISVLTMSVLLVEASFL